jgi:hypothetical protein
MAASFPLGESKPLRPDLPRAVSTDPALILVEVVPVLSVIALHNRDLLVGQTRQPADDLMVGAPVLEIWDQVVDCNATGRFDTSNWSPSRRSSFTLG